MVEEIIKLYTKDKFTIMQIAEKMNSSYKKIRKILLKNNVEMRKGGHIIGTYHHSIETKEKIRISKLGDKNPMYGKCSEETRALLWKYRVESLSDPIKREKRFKKQSETRIKNGLSKGSKNPMSNPEVIKKWAASNYNNLQPNKKEVRLFTLIQTLSCNFVLNTTGNIIIENKIPDIIDNKNKKIVEFYGDYWHKDDTIEDQEERIALFKRNGYDCIIIWEKELKNEKSVINRLSDFIK